jgi:iron complex outermembrane receptor protein
VVSANALSPLVVKLNISTVGINEVVVIGYGQVRKGDATGSVSSVSSQDFNKGAITSPEALLAGKVSGVQITSGGGAPGSSSTIRIRGGASLSASNDPLIIIDGVPVATDKVSGMDSPLSTINPNDIETFTILKDASATAIYGSRASNGVIIITTKKGSKKGLKVGFSSNLSLGVKTNQIDVMGAGEYADFIKSYYGATSTPASLLTTSSTNWQDQIFRSAFGHDESINLSGAVMGTPVRFSYGFSGQDGILKTSNMNRHTVSLNVSRSFLDDHITVEANAKGMTIYNRFASTDAISNALLFDPSKPVMDPLSIYGGYTTWMDGSKPAEFAPKNPLARLQQRTDDARVNRAIANLKIDYKFHGLPELVATLNLGTDLSSSDGGTYIPVEAAFGYYKGADSMDHSGEDRTYTQDKKNNLLDFYLNYSHTFAPIKSKIDIMGGYSWQHFWKSDYVNSTSVDGKYVIKPAKTTPTENYLISFFGRMNYTLNDRYLLTLTIRDDGTSRFAPDKRWGLFPSVALGWRLDQEGFIKSIPAISSLKLRAGYGITGQQNITDNDYPYLAQYSMSQSTARYLFGNSWETMARPKGYDPNIKWEETTTYNVGLDFGILQNRINGSIDLYKRVTADLINDIPVAAGTNFSNIITTNVGNLENSGIDFSIDAQVIDTDEFSWNVAFNINKNINKITKLIAVQDPNYKGVPVGLVSGGTGNYVKINSEQAAANSFYVYQQVYDKAGMPIEGMYVDRNNDGKLTIDDKYRFHTSTPDMFMGLSSRFTYKSWDFSFSGRASFGNYVYNNFDASNANYQYVYNSPWIQNLPLSAAKTKFKTQQLLSDFYVQDASFFRMDNMSLGYSFDKLPSYISSLRLSLTAQNVFVITDYTGLDPEVYDGIDNNIYPRPTTFIFGLNIEF